MQTANQTKRSRRPSPVRSFWWKSARCLAALGSSPRRASWILGYHRVGADGVTSSTTLARFEEQMDLLAAVARPLPLHELLLRARENQLSGAEVAVTFDDGYRDQAAAVTIAQARGVPSTIFVPTSFPDSDRSFFWEGRTAAECKAITRRLRRGEEAPDGLGPSDRLSWAELSSLQRSGVDIEAHTHTHPILAGLSDGRLDEEIAQSVQVFQERLGRSPRILAYPNGEWGDFDRRAIPVMARHGFEFGVTALFGAVGGSDLPWHVRRVMVSDHTAVDLAALFTHGALPDRVRRIVDRARGRW